MKLLKAFAAALAAFLFYIPTVSADDQTTVLDNLMGQPPNFIQGLRDTFGKVYLTVPVYDIQYASGNTPDPTDRITGGGFVIAPVDGKITKLYSTIYISDVGSNDGVGTIRTATMATATTLVAFISTTEITGGNITIADGSAQGEIDEVEPTAANTVSAGDRIVIESMGGTSETVDAMVTIELDRDN